MGTFAAGGTTAQNGSAVHGAALMTKRRETPYGRHIARLVRPPRAQHERAIDPAGDVLAFVLEDAGDARAAEVLVRQLVEAATERKVRTVELDAQAVRALNAPPARRTLAVYLIVAELARNGIAHSPSLWLEAIARRVRCKVSSVQSSLRALKASGVLKKWQAPRAKPGVCRNAEGHAYNHYKLFYVPRAFERAVRKFWERRHAPAPRPEAVPRAPQPHVHGPVVSTPSTAPPGRAPPAEAHEARLGALRMLGLEPV